MQSKKNAQEPVATPPTAGIRPGVPQARPGAALHGSNGNEGAGRGAAHAGTGEAPLPASTLPRGGGALRGLGETFAVNAANGTASFTVPLALPEGRSGCGPSLALAYDSGAGNGPFGLGWSLAVPAISRRTDRGVPGYVDDAGREGVPPADVFLLSGAEDLVPVRLPDGSLHDHVRTEGGGVYTVRRYRPRTEGGWERIERWRDLSSGEVHWRATSPGNVTRIFGRDEQSRIADPGSQDRVFSWLLSEMRDDRGNTAQYVYRREDDRGVDFTRPQERGREGYLQAQRYLQRVRYGNATPDDAAGACRFEVVFDYGDHPDADPLPEPDGSLAWPQRADPFSVHRAGFEVRTRRLCRRVLVFHRFPADLGPAPYLVGSTVLAYDERPEGARLASVTVRGHVRGAPAAELPSLSFGYTEARQDPTVRVAEAPNLPEGIDGARYRWADLEGDGVGGVVTEQGGGWFFSRSRGGGRFEPARALSDRPAWSIGERSGVPAAQFMDVEGDGRLHLVRLDGPSPGFFALEDPEDFAERQASSAVAALRGWEAFRAFAKIPNLDFAREPRLRFLDLTGDGRADAVLFGDELVYHPSLGREGFGEPERRFLGGGDEERGPVLLFQDPTEAIHLADMDGDGLADVVRVRNGEVCYWPNQGHGRFGGKVTMSGAPVFAAPDRWDAARLRLADVDGSGTTDLLYLGDDTASYWINQAGNGFGAARRVDAFPPVDRHAGVAVMDLLGTGTGCLVWSSPLPEAAGLGGTALRYVDLVGGSKPNLLASVLNGRGGEIRLSYAASTRFYLEDREAGSPWATRLPFPVHVVERVETLDRVTGAQLVTRYRYRHGHYDGPEREFRGFGRVDQWDAEAFVVDGHPERRLDQSPVETRTWFHTGAHLPHRDLIARYRDEFWAGDTAAWPHPTSPLPAGLSPEERREACRALRGRPLRREVYGRDDESERVHPYAVTEFGYDVVRVQPRGAGPHAVFNVYVAEERTSHYERRPSDPRVSQSLTLRVDEHGNVLEAAAIGYPRRVPDGPSADEQAKLRLSYIVRSYCTALDDDGAYRVGVPAASRTYEVLGLSPSAGTPFGVGALRVALPAAALLDFEAEPPAGTGPFRRLVDAGRHLYWADDLSGPLPSGESGRRALPHETWRAAFTPGLLVRDLGEGNSAGLAARGVSDALLRGEGACVLDGGIWWARGGRTEFDPTRFFLPVRHADPWGNVTRVEYDAYALLIVAHHDALPGARTNTVGLRNHYRTLLPWHRTDANGNRSAVRFDALGRVSAAAELGKAGAGDGDFLDEGSLEASPADDPTGRFAYGALAWRDSGTPCWVRVEARERHRGDRPGRWEVTVAYHGGTGEAVLVKKQAPPGRAPFRDAAGELVRGTDGRPVLAHTADRWIGTGRVVRNNKGNPVKQYEPYFVTGDGWDDESDLVEHGVTAVLRYDAPGRAVRTDLPDGTFSRVDFGPWEQATFGAGDTVRDSDWYAARQTLPPGYPERRAADLAAAHHDTPSRAYLDSLGRPVVTVEESARGVLHVTRTRLDLEGNVLSVTDSRGNVVVSQSYDLLGRKLRVASADTGVTCALLDAAGRVMRAWDGSPGDAGERAARHRYDPLGRPTHRWVRVDGAETLAERIVYGEAHPQAAERSLRGQPWRAYDGAGMKESVRFDFKGNCLETRRRLAAVPDADPDWTAAGAVDEDAPALLAALDVATAPWLESAATGEFVTRARFDALNRPVAVIHPDGSLVVPGYHPGGLLDAVAVHLRGAAEPTPFVDAIDYDARGQRQVIRYSGGVRTEYEYDPLNFRLRAMTTTRVAQAASAGGAALAAATLQAVRYVYDAVGNIVEAADAAQPERFFENAVAPAGSRYRYDALSRLVWADGREHAGQNPPQPDADEYPLHPLRHPNDAQALRRYEESYRYDAVGNVEEVAHASGGAVQWRRRYRYAAANNRLLATSAPGDADGTFSITAYAHDVFGNLTRMPHLAQLAWDAADRLGRAELGGGGTALCVYDGDGDRVRKVVRRNDSSWTERVYLGGWETYRERGATGDIRFERQALHVDDGARRIALVETVTRDGGTQLPGDRIRPMTRLQLDNFLGTVCLEMDPRGALLSFEEFYPFGATSYHSATGVAEVSRKRYRYTGKERDEETGLYYYGARYYASWLGRWTSADPAGLVDGVNLYAYAKNSPVNRRDPTGKQSVGEDQRVLALGRWNLGPLGRVDPVDIARDAERALGPGWRGVTLHDVPGYTAELFVSLRDTPPNGPQSPFRGVASSYFVQAALEGEGNIRAIYFDLHGADITQPGQTNSELRSVVANIASGRNRVDIHFQQGGRLSTIRAGSTTVEGAPLPEQISAHLPPSFRPRPPGGHGGGGGAHSGGGGRGGRGGSGGGGTGARSRGGGTAGPAQQVRTAIARGGSTLRAIAADPRARTAAGGALVAYGRATASVAVRTLVPGAAEVMEAVATARTMGLANTARLGLAAAGETAVVAGVTGLAVASVGWAVEDTRRALRGQPTLTDEAVDFWRREGLVGGMSQFGNELWDFVNE